MYNDQCIESREVRKSPGGLAAAGNRKIAILIPCYNEGAAVRQVVESFRVVMPEADVFVYDNNSSDGTRALAKQAGAIVREVKSQGKGHVVRRMFADVEADIFVLVDGDGTYDAEAAAAMLDLLEAGNLDMVVGCRQKQTDGAYPAGHVFGNMLFNVCIAMLFGRRMTDILSGYRVVSRRFAKSFPCSSNGFEIETELAVHALSLSLPVEEYPTRYFARQSGSQSKLRTWRDGAAILWMIARLFEHEKPFVFFSTVAAILGVTSVALAWPIVLHYLAAGDVPRLPSAVLSASIAILSFLSLFSGTILESVAWGRREAKRLAYMNCIDRPARACAVQECVGGLASSRGRQLTERWELDDGSSTDPI
jgi:hypothetical protein